MKSICLFFHAHQPFRHRRYRFFDIGNYHHYYDDYSNETIMRRVAGKSYLPTNELLLTLANKLKEKFKVSFSITGLALEQFELSSPEVIESFKKLTLTGCVEFLSETYSHALSSLKNPDVFEKQVRMHEECIFGLFGQKPKVFRNTEMIYSDKIGTLVAKMGYKGILTEGVKQILGQKSPNYVYKNATNPNIKILMRNSKLSNDISFGFLNKNQSGFPLTAEKLINRLEKTGKKDEVVNIFLNYESFGEYQPKESGIFDFLENFITLVANSPILKFATPSGIIEELQPVSAISVPRPVSWADKECGINTWLGNDMQKEAYKKLYSLSKIMGKCSNPELQKDWNYLQASDYFYSMSTKNYSQGSHQNLFDPFNTPYEAFINYMNVLSDFKIRLSSLEPENKIENEIASLHKLIDEKEKKIKKMEAELLQFKKRKNKKSTGNA